MNADHGEAVELYATALLGLSAGDWRLTGIDPRRDRPRRRDNARPA